MCTIVDTSMIYTRETVRFFSSVFGGLSFVYMRNSYVRCCLRRLRCVVRRTLNIFSHTFVVDRERFCNGVLEVVRLFLSEERFLKHLHGAIVWWSLDNTSVFVNRVFGFRTLHIDDDLFTEWAQRLLSETFFDSSYVPYFSRISLLPSITQLSAL